MFLEIVAELGCVTDFARFKLLRFVMDNGM